MNFTVSEGKSRTAKVWKPVQYDWAGFCAKLAEPIRTSETAAQYAAASKDIQSGLKDVGGFVGGTLDGERRSSQTIRDRQLITLDADYPDADFLDNLPWALPCAAAVYTTHSHTPETPRYRIIIPIKRPVVADEYEPIARKIAEDIGIQYFDPTTFQPARLMYWPSAPQDGEYIFEAYDGDPLDPDAVLQRYSDWHDVSSWPVAESESKLTERKSKTEDPLQKGGIIGAFCRTYTIPEAITKFLPDAYVPTAGFKDRYTYTGSSTSGGLVLFDGGTLALSYHAQDPVQKAVGKHEVNAFDIVRIHLFGDKDAHCRESTPIENRASYKAMMELAVKDPQVSRTIMREKTEEAREAFEGLTDEVDDSWMEKLDVEKDGNAANTLKNLHTILQHDPELKGGIAFNAFSNQICIVKPLPWHKQIMKQDGDRWEDVDDEKIQRYLERYRKKGFTMQKVIGQILDVAETHSYHPVRDYLNSLTWDGKPRLDTLLIDWFDAETTPKTEEYVRAVTRKTLVGAVNRVMEPGCAMQYTLVLTGEQDLGKSTFISDLAGRWFSDNLCNIGTKEAQDQIQGYWIIEMAELAATKKIDVEPLKAFLTSRVDIYRAAYGRRTAEHPRQCIFIGTDNSGAFLRDETGNRRFWPVHVQTKYQDKGRLTRDEVDQIWAEAVYYYQQGELPYLDPATEAVAREVQGDYKMEDPWTAAIQEYLDKPIPVDWYDRTDNEKQLWLSGAFSAGADVRMMERDTVTMAEVWSECFNGNPRDLKKHMTQLHQAMAGVEGWYRVQGKIKFHGKSVNAYRREQELRTPDGKIIKMSEVRGSHQ